jgi:hypothetical protein
VSDPSPTDRGTAAVAAVEEAVFGGTDADVAVGREALHARVAEVVAGPWWQASGPPVTVTTPRRSTRSSTARSRLGQLPVEIRLADPQLTLATVAHELAHALAGVEHGHDETFRAAHVDVAALLAGAGAAQRLAAAYAAFDLAVAARAWARPWRADGETFRIVV